VSAPPSRVRGDVETPESLRTPGDHMVDAPIMCSITRFGLRNARSLLASYLDFRRVVGSVQASPPTGLLRSAFLVENPTTWYSFSIWSGYPDFSAQVPTHVDAARRVFGRLAMEPERGPELWSTKWRLVSVTNNLNWDDFDLRQLILDGAGAKRRAGL
jgi:hypothetical protein